jgi:hypothetical protein
MRASALYLAALVAVGCGDDDSMTDPDASVPVADAALADGPVDADITPDADPFMPATLRETGLYSDWDNEVVAADVLEFEPEYELWSDGAEKRRWVYLPPGSQIDTTSMDNWVYPVGTKMWKEFTRDGTRVETRLLYKTGPDKFDWFMVAYAWNENQDEAVAVPDGADDVLGTEHDIPNRSDCRQCHNKMADIALGFIATQLDHELGGLDLATLVADGWLSAPPAGSAPYFDIPGTAAEVAALGYLNANCGGCHQQGSPTMDNVPVELRLYIADLEAEDVQATAAYRTAVGVTSTLDGPALIVDPGSPSTSSMHHRMNDRDAIAMPPVGSELIDDSGLAIIDAWISALPVP